MRIALLVEYDGTAYHGWQLQPGESTVQAALEDALSSLLDTRIRIHASGRTDAGVHARGQVVHFDVVSCAIPPEKICAAVKGLLPPDIDVRASGQVADDFHARYQACERYYIYRLDTSTSVLDRNRVWDLPYSLDNDLLDTCAGLLLGRHDFSSFCQAQTVTENHICHIHAAAWSRMGSQLQFQIRGDRFLHHMVRMLVGSMVEVGRGKWKLQSFTGLLDQPDHQAATRTAPPQGLVLEEVGYPPEIRLPW